MQAFFHIILNNSYGPLIHALPLSLADKTYGIQGAEVHDENRDQAERQLDDQASIVDSEEAGYEKAQAKKRERARTPSVASTSYPPDKPVQAQREDVDVDNAIENEGSMSSPKPTPTSPENPPPLSHKSSSVQAIDEQEGPKEFYHPASVDMQRPVWIPRDELGLGEEEERFCRERGIEASMKGAVMDGKGNVRISEGPPEGGVEF